MNIRNRYSFAAITALCVVLLGACSGEDQQVAEVHPATEEQTTAAGNPFDVALNQPIAYADVTAADVTAYADSTKTQILLEADAIRAREIPEFDNVIQPIDGIFRDLSKAGSNSFMLYWTSPDAGIRDAGLEAYKQLDSLRVDLMSDRGIFEQVKAVADTGQLAGVQKKLVSDLMLEMEHTGVSLGPEELEKFRKLTREINDLTSQYSNNMNSDDSVLVLDEKEALGLPENLISKYAREEGGFAIPVIAANRSPVLNNAAEEDTRRAFATLYANRAADQNLEILDQLVARRHEIAAVMGYPSFAAYDLTLKMARTPDNVWQFLNGLIEATAEKTAMDLVQLKEFRVKAAGVPVDQPMEPWNMSFYKNSILKEDYGVDHEKVREYLPLENALSGMMDLYQELLGLQFRAVENPSVWHEEVEMYEVYENDVLVGRFYLDLFPRPNKESWFYGVPLTPGNLRTGGYEVPEAMMLGNFTRASDDLPSLISHSELSILFHEFGHIVNSMSFNGEFAYQNSAPADFGEAMSQIFENWIWEYDVLRDFAIHYETGEVLPEALFDQMHAARNVGSGISAQGSLANATYDLTLYNQQGPDNFIPTDDIWRSVYDRLVVSKFIENTHPQAAWIHINTHPVYYYGYLWSEVYAQDMFTQFEENGLRDTVTGVRYRNLIMANGTQRPAEEAVEEFLGRPSNNEAYIRSLGLE